MRVAKIFNFFLVFIALAALLAVGITAGWKIADQRSYNRRHQYPLLDPSVSNPDAHPEIINFDPLRQNVKNYLASLKLSHSFYFEYLPNGINIRDGEDNVSQAASLLKTPLVMDLYKLAEQGRINLDSASTVIPAEIDTDPNWGNPTRLKAGDTLSLRQAVKITLQYSDNTTLNVIKDRIDPLLDAASDSFRSLDITLNVTETGATSEQINVSSRSYSSILKCLYYSCFNSPADSTKIISDLIGSAEKNRLAAGIPPGIKIAHKVGSGGVSAQSDCGIVYYPNKPYLACLMFFDISNSSKNNSATDPYFAHVSKMIYDYINKTGDS
jgi:beta-lactamase class A